MHMEGHRSMREPTTTTSAIANTSLQCAVKYNKACSPAPHPINNTHATDVLHPCRAVTAADAPIRDDVEKESAYGGPQKHARTDNNNVSYRQH